MNQNDIRSIKTTKYKKYYKKNMIKTIGSHDIGRNHTENTQSFVAHKIFQEVSKLNPFSPLSKKSAEETVESVVRIHQEESERKIKLHTQSQKRQITKLSLPFNKTKKQLPFLQTQCRQLLRRSPYAPRRSKPLIFNPAKRSQTVQQAYQDAQGEVAKQMIAQTKRQKQNFAQALTKFQQLIRKATVSFIDQHNVNVNAKKFKKLDFTNILQHDKVCTNYQDQLFSFEKKYIRRKNNSLKVNKEDVYIYLKSSNKAINLAKIQQQHKYQLDQAEFQDKLKKSPKNRIKGENSNDLLLRYYKKSPRQPFYPSAAQLTQP